MNAVTAWVSDHPFLFTYVMWPVLSGLVLGIFKPRTPEQYATMNPYLAGFLMFVSATGFDPSKMLQGLQKLLTGKSIPISAARARDLLQTATVLDPESKTVTTTPSASSPSPSPEVAPASDPPSAVTSSKPPTEPTSS